MDSEASLPHQSTKQQLSLSMMRISCAYVLKHTDVPLGESSIDAAWRGQHLRRLMAPVFTPLDEASVYTA